ncbi:hypothetical protein ACWGJQ_26290 [Peribacillus simplex]
MDVPVEDCPGEIGLICFQVSVLPEKPEKKEANKPAKSQVTVVKVEFNTYRNEPNTETKYGLSLNDFQYEKFKQGQVFEFTNFPISVKGNELEFELSWHGKPHSKEVQGRKYKETFTFTPTK